MSAPLAVSAADAAALRACSRSGVAVRTFGQGDDDGERVGDDVMHLSGDAGAFGRGCELRLLVALDQELA